ncbi:MAG: FHA domain-containing protein, partial [Sphingomonadales bacterium]
APAPEPPAPPQKIVLDPAPDPISVPAAATAPISVSVSKPSLISDAGIPIPLAEGETVVGREVGLGLSLAGESTVSRRHATIVRTGNTVVVQDAGSTNGTFVNGAPASGPVTVNPGDTLQFGSVRFRYEG